MTYLQALSSSACPNPALSQNSLNQHLDSISRSLTVIDVAYSNDEEDLIDFLLMAAQQELAILYQRFSLPVNATTGQGIIAMGRRLGELRRGLSNSTGTGFYFGYEDWKSDWQEFVTIIQEQGAESLYEKGILENWLLTNP